MKEEKNNTHAPWWQPGLMLFTRLSGWIAGPVILAVFLGKWLDRKYGTEPWLFLATVGAAFILSSFGIVKDSINEMKKIEQKEKKKKFVRDASYGDAGGEQEKSDRNIL